MDIYDLKTDGVYLPVRYYANDQMRNVVLVASLHQGEKKFYECVDDILRPCDVVIYEELRPQQIHIMEQVDASWDHVLHSNDLNEAFLAATFSPTPQMFLRDHNLYEEAHSFDYKRPCWISGDAIWHTQEEYSLPRRIWDHIRAHIRRMDGALKHHKVTEAQDFFKKVHAHCASMRDFIIFQALYEKEIQRDIFQSIAVDPRDDIVFHIFDEIVRTKDPRYVGIKFGNGHMPHMDELLQERRYVHTKTQWLRILTTAT